MFGVWLLLHVSTNTTRFKCNKFLRGFKKSKVLAAQILWQKLTHICANIFKTNMFEDEY